MAVDTFLDAPQTNLSGVARILVRAGRIDAKAAEDLSKLAHEKRSSFVAQLIETNTMKPLALAHALSTALAVPLLDLDAVDPKQLPQGIVDAKLVSQYRIFPLGKRGGRLFIACADPTDQEAVERIKFATQLAPEWIVVEYDKLMKLVTEQQTTTTQSMEALTSSDFEFEVTDEDPTAAQEKAEVSTEVEDAPVVKFLHKMLIDAINLRASDLHFEPYEFNYRVRFRVDGELREITQPPIAIKEKLASRIKVISRLDISEKRVPQDGRMKLKFGSKTIDFRVSTLPTLYGEKIVIRVLDPSSARLGIEALGYEPAEKERLMAAIVRPYGMVLVTGPTGSGKTVSLYTGLNILNREDTNISTAEDPAEINLPGVNQVNVNPKVGLTFAAAMRAFLRQDPDVIMVGEIRDLETAEIAIKAAQTGHLVLSTLHTNDAPQTLTRLVDMGVKPYAIATSVSLIIAQRLARRLCSQCKQPMDIPEEALLKEGFTHEDMKAGGLRIFGPKGCGNCTDGYKGRVGIYQVLPISDTIARIILAGGSAPEIGDQAAKEGVWDLRRSGLEKVRSGLTSLEEVNSVTVD
jgi:type IV pilus assembly protein PilB